MVIKVLDNMHLIHTHCQQKLLCKSSSCHQTSSSDGEGIGCIEELSVSLKDTSTRSDGHFSSFNTILDFGL